MWIKYKKYKKYSNRLVKTYKEITYNKSIIFKSGTKIKRKKKNKKSKKSYQNYKKAKKDKKKEYPI